LTTLHRTQAKPTVLEFRVVVWREAWAESGDRPSLPKISKFIVEICSLYFSAYLAKWRQTFYSL